MSKDRVEFFKQIMNHQDYTIADWIHFYKIKRMTYTQCLERIVLDLALQKESMSKEMLIHYERCPYGSNYVRPPDDFKPFKFIEPKPIGFFWMMFFIWVIGFILFIIAKRAGLL